MPDEKLLPNLNVSVNVPAEIPKDEIVKPEQLVEFYNEILTDIREDRKEIDEVLKPVIDMVINGGDASTSSKELLGNLFRLKSETADRKTKVVDLLMRAYLKERDTFPRFLNATQNNQIKIEDNTKKRQLLKTIIGEIENK